MRIPLWLTVGILAGLWMPVAAMVKVPPWPLFVAWAAFFAAGGDEAALKKVYPALLSGVLWGYLTILLGADVLAFIFGSWGVAVFVGIFAAIMVILAKYPFLSFAPAAFFGFATYFGTSLDFKATLTGLIVGPVVGYLSVKATTMFSSAQKD
ncbi:MAG: DUF1097 domain-containing protein [Peptococcaceae bacterium]|jgi:hypothetical protein|nr:DUF1097 domain-containing protein [Peptococcaceae bacterium]MDH7526401.1 DUF1097 domain-containing protein [Peptococcaceae bacterium]